MTNVGSHNINIVNTQIHNTNGNSQNIKLNDYNMNENDACAHTLFKIAAI